MRGYDKSGVVEAIRAAGGAIFALTSEPQSLASEAEASWGLGFPSIGDPHQEILNECRERGWIDLFVNDSADGLLEARSWSSHLKGFFQPGVLALAPEGRVLYRWRCRPTRRNVGGALERPTPEHAWRETRSRLEGTHPEPPLDDAPELDTKAPAWPLFVLLLLAHGRFLTPREFPLGRSDDAQSADPRQMFPRLIGFGAAWLAAFALLPTLWVGLALVGWGLIVSPGVARIHREFQNVPEGEPGPT